MTTWFDGTSTIACDIDRVNAALADLGECFVGVTGLMPGMTEVELVSQGDHSVTIKTNEGLMVRTNIAKRVGAESVAVEFDERYEAGSRITTSSHFVHEFTPSDTGVAHRMVIRDVDAPGFLGFFYKRFGAAKIGNAFLTAYARHLETEAD